MASIHLVTGGARSGKSDHARKLAEAMPGPRVFIATCPLTDAEMEARIGRHKREREGLGWTTIEEQLGLAGALARSEDSGVILVDCLTLWVSNLMLRAHGEGLDFGDEDMSARAAEVAEAAAKLRATVFFVTNEVGLGIVPENEVARRYRDLAGRCNQAVAARAERVTLMVAGLPLKVK